MRRLVAAAFVVAVAAAVGAAALRGAGPRFYPDDPLWIDDDQAFDAAGVAPLEDLNAFDFVENTFVKPGEKRDVRAMNVNSLDEVPDSNWFNNRIGRREMPIAEIVRGPDRVDRVDLDQWVVSAGKSSGLQPGFRMTDPAGHLYQIEVDPPSNPELTSGAEIIGTAFYHAFGYHVVDVYPAEIDAARLVISEKATIRDPLNGKRRRLTRRDLNDVFKRAAREKNGRYRVVVSRFADGKPLGNFRYYGSRPDDPNDIVPHEHRRELRGARVFAAWLNHDDSRGVNSLDMLEQANGKSYVKHYMFDFGSIMGSGTVFAEPHRPGNEYILEWRPGWMTLATLGLYVRPWMLIDYPDVPASVGRFEGDAFTPEQWKPEYPNQAFGIMRPDDAFWAARIVSKFSDAMVRGVVAKAQYSDPKATDYITATLIKRRDKVLAAWLNQVNPVVDVTLDGTGALTFRNAAVDARAAAPADSYAIRWFRLDNAADVRTDVGAQVTVTDLRAAAPPGLLNGAGEYVGLTMTATHPKQPGWARPATFYFRRAGGAWQTVGVER
ncbi:MAG: hypothetical protein ABI868_19445 [Acidobacteriota bacterium]